MEKRNVYTFVDGAETTTMEFGRLDTGGGLREGDRQGRHHPVLLRRPARETTIRFRETEEYSLEDVADTLREHSDDVFIGDIAKALDFWGVAYEKNEKSGPSRVRDSPLLTRRTAHHLATCAPRALFVARRNHVRCGRSAGARVPRTSARPRVSRGGRGLLRGHGFACGPTAARLGPHAPAVCLWRRAQPCPLRRPGLSRASRMAHYGPRHLRPAAPRSPLPWLRLGSSLLRCAGGEAMSIVAESSDAAGPRPRAGAHGLTPAVCRADRARGGHGWDNADGDTRAHRRGPWPQRLPTSSSGTSPGGSSSSSARCWSGSARLASPSPRVPTRYSRTSTSTTSRGSRSSRSRPRRL